MLPVLVSSVASSSVHRRQSRVRAFTASFPTPQMSSEAMPEQRRHRKKLVSVGLRVSKECPPQGISSPREKLYEVIMAVKSGEVAVNLGNSRVEFPPSLSNRWELIGTIPAFILSKSHQNRLTVKNVENALKGSGGLFRSFLTGLSTPPPLRRDLIGPRGSR